MLTGLRSFVTLVAHVVVEVASLKSRATLVLAPHNLERTVTLVNLQIKSEKIKTWHLMNQDERLKLYRIIDGRETFNFAVVDPGFPKRGRGHQP